MLLSTLFRKKSTSTIVQQGGDGEENTGLHKVLNVRDLTFLGLQLLLAAEHLVLLAMLVFLVDQVLFFFI